MVTIDRIAHQCSAVMAERGIGAGMLWVGRQAGMDIYKISMTNGPYLPPYGLEPTALPVLGMQLNIDDYLPPDVWRLADEHGTLLYDCREGRPLRDASAQQRAS